MKHLFFLLFISSLVAPCLSYGQATKSIPLGKHIGIDTRIPVTVDTSAVDRAVLRQLQQIGQQARDKEYARRQRTPQYASLRLTQDDLSDGKEYVSTPQGDILKGSWQACEYFYNWEKQQTRSKHANLEDYQNQREMILLMFGISDEVCGALAQQHRAAPDEPVGLAGTVPEDVGSIPAGTSVANTGSPEPQIAVSDETKPQPHTAPISAHKAKRYLKKFMKEHGQEVAEALGAKKRGERLHIRQRRLLTSYDSLCALYQEAVGHPAEVCVN